jgi:hypothetical protein
MAEANDKNPLVENLNVQSGGKAVVVGSLHGDIHVEIQSPLTADQRVRLLLLQRVREDWIQGVLNQSLYKAARINLNLEARSDAVAYRSQLIVQVPDWEPVAIRPGAGIAEIFDRFGHALLISGASGTGKTTLLLELCNILIDRALEDERHPIPVVFHLSTWALKRKPLASWIVSELKRLGVRNDLAQKWIDAGEILPLLDGLDEVAATYRTDCLNAINEFRDRWGLCPIALCSRTADLAVGQKLRLRGAVTVRPLTNSQIEEQLARSPDLAPLLRAKREDASLAKLLETPLMLWVASLAYRDKSVIIVKEEGIEQTQQRLFSTFVHTQLNRGAVDIRFSRTDTLRWLSWLAVTLERNNRKIFYLEDLNPQWLGKINRPFIVRFETAFAYALSCALVIGLSGSIFGGLFGILEHNWQYALKFGLSDGLWTGGLCGLFFGIVSSFTDLRPVEAFSLRFAGDRLRIRRAIRSSAIFGLAFSLLFVGLAILGGIIAIELLNEPRSELRGMVTVGLILGLLVGVAVGIANLVTAERVDLRRRPNQGTHSSIRRACTVLAVVAFCVTVVGGLIGIFGSILAWKLLPAIHEPIVLGLNGEQFIEKVGGLRGLLLAGLQLGSLHGLRFGMVLGLFGGMISGGAFAIRHFVTRISAWLHQETPLAYASFLDFAVDRLFLLKLAEGGGYLFAHDTLAKYFISVNQSEQPSATAATE